MSGLLFRGLTLTCFLALLFSCKKINDSEYAPKTTDLKVRVYEYDFDNSLAGGPIAAAEVFVYHTRTNFFLRVGHVATGKTDASGEITFTDLDPQNYYIYVRKFKDSTFYQNYFMDSLDSKNTNFNIGEALIKNAITTVSIPVAEAKYPTKFALKGFTRINREDSHYVADSLKYIHIDMFNQDYTTDGEIRTGIAAGGGDDKNSSDFTVAKEFNAADFASNFGIPDTVIYFKEYQSPDTTRAKDVFIRKYSKTTDFLVDDYFENSMVRFIDDKTYGKPIMKNDKGDLYVLEVVWYHEK